MLNESVSSLLLELKPRYASSVLIEIKQLASKISDKRQEKYGYVVNHIRVKLRFALLKSVLIAIRGTRGKIAKERLLGHVSLNMVPHEAGYET